MLASGCFFAFFCYIICVIYFKAFFDKFMHIKYNRVSTLQQSGVRYTADSDSYDLVLFDKVSGTVSFKDREEGKKLVRLVKEGKVSEVVVEELSRLGRNTGDVVNTLDFFDEHEVTVKIRNLGIQSRVDGKKNQIWKMITSLLSSMYEMELENIKERTMVGRMVYVQQGGKLGRKVGTTESERDFLEKPLTKKILKQLRENRTIMDITKVVGCSSTTVVKAKRLGRKHGMLIAE